MARLDGKKKSALPLVLGIAVLAALGAGGYYLYDQNRGVDTIAVAPGEVEAMNTKPGGLGVDGNVDVDAKPSQDGRGDGSNLENANNATTNNATTDNATENTAPASETAPATSETAPASEAPASESAPASGAAQ